MVHEDIRLMVLIEVESHHMTVGQVFFAGRRRRPPVVKKPGGLREEGEPLGFGHLKKSLRIGLLLKLRIMKGEIAAKWLRKHLCIGGIEDEDAVESQAIADAVPDLAKHVVDASFR